MSAVVSALVAARATSVLAFAYLALGASVPNPELARLAGGTRTLLGPATTLFVFVDPDQERSAETLAELASLQSELGDRPVEWVVVVSDRFAEPAVRSALEQSGGDFEAVIDAGDALYGELGVRLYPSIGIADPEHRLAAYLPYRKVNYRATVRAHLLHVLGEIDDAELAAVTAPRQIEWSGNGTKAATNLRMARLLLDAGKLDKALTQALRAIEEAPESASAHGLAAAIRAALGECEQALEHAQRAAELDPEEPSAREARARCEG